MLLLAGPAPGAVGSCGGDDGQSEPADFGDYCQEREQLVCERRKTRGEITAAAAIDCRRRAIELCGRRSFVPGCTPTRREADACVNALYSLSTLDQDVDELAECRDLCGLPPEEQDGPRSLLDQDDDAGTEEG